MEESSERLANFLLQFNLKEIQSLLQEEKKNFQIIEEEFLTIHKTGQVKELLTNLKKQIMQLSYTKVIETIDSTLKIQAVCEKFEETRKNSSNTKANVITISDDDIEEKNEKKHDIADKEIEIIIENDENYKCATSKEKQSIKDLSPREELKSSKESPQEAKEANPAKSKRDIFKRIVIPKHDQEENEEDQLLWQEYLSLEQKDKDILRDQEKKILMEQEKQMEQLKKKQQEILDQIKGKKQTKYGKQGVLKDKEEESEEIEEEDNYGISSGEEEFDGDDDYGQEKRRLKKLSALSKESKSITKQGNKTSKSPKIINRKNNSQNSNSAQKSSQKLTDSSKKRKSGLNDSNSLTHNRSSEKNSKLSSNYTSGFIPQPSSYTEYLTNLINVTTDNNLPIPKIFLNELFFEKRRDGLKSVGTMLTEDDKQFVVEFYEALRGKLSKAEEYLLLSGELILGLVSQAQKKPPPFVLPEETVLEEDEEEMVKTPRKKRIVESDHEQEEEEKKRKTFEKELEQVLERNGIRKLHENRNENSFECEFEEKNRQKKIINGGSEGSSNSSNNNITHNKDKRQDISEKKNEKKIIKKGNRNAIYHEESDEEMRKSSEDLSIDSSDVRLRMNDIKSEHPDSEEQIYF